MNYVYAVVERQRAAPAPAEPDRPALRPVAHGRIAAIVSDRSDARVRVTEEDLWAHERVVESLMAQGAVLPMRFGSVLHDDEAVEAMLAERCAELEAALERVAGAVELGVRAAWDPAASAAGGAAADAPGAAYLLGLSRSRQRARALAERLDRAVGGLSRTRVQRLLTAPSLPLSAAYLVDRGSVDAFCDAVATLDEEVEDVQIICTGPWPPYSFAGGQGR